MSRVGLTCLTLALSGGCDDNPKPADACTRENAFLAEQRACTKSSDCVIVGACSGGFGFRAVQRSAQAEAQSLSDNTACGASFDGPTYAAVCEQGQCTPRLTGGACGAPARDGGTYGCPPGQEQYAPSCDTPQPQGFDAQGCETHCDGAGDTSCASGLACKQVKVVSATRATCPDLIDVWLCRPAS